MESDNEEESIPSLFFETIESSSGWIDIEASTVPPVSLNNIHQYFVTKCLKRDDVTACKPFEKGYRIFHAGFVQTVSIHSVDAESAYCIIRAAVMPSQRQNPAYKTAVAIVKTAGEVKYGHCMCIAGKCSSCNHVAALLFFMDHLSRTPSNNSSSLACCLTVSTQTLTENTTVHLVMYSYTYVFQRESLSTH